MNRPRRIQRLVAGVITCLVVGWCSALGSSADAAPAHAAIASSGSSWAANAVDVWDGMAYKEGLQVSFTAVGSAQGRKDFANYANDFAVSDIGYQGRDPVSGAADSSDRPYAYLPIVAGGTSFPYQVRVRGQLVRTLRLSGQTLAKIFTLQITNWNDPEITKDNNGHALPSLPIIPVVHSEGSGSSYQFTRYLATQFPSIWNSKNHPGPTEYFVRQGSMVAENGSDSMINFVTSGAANGAIGYDEYSYALGHTNQGLPWPVAKVLNPAGYFTLPNQYNVAVALTKAIINMDKSSPDYLLQNLNNVYTNPDPRAYPVSSYSYGVIPTSATDKKMSTAKRQTMADYLYLSICQGQQQMGPFGYSPLPINLVQAGFAQIGKLHSADSGVVLTNRNVSTCHNPTFIAGQPNRNYLAEIAPQPAACDKVGAGPCTGTIDTGLQNPVNGRAPTPQGNSSLGPGSTSGGPGGGSPTGPGGSLLGPGGTGASGPGGTGGTGSAGAASAAAAGSHINPNTGQLVSGGPTSATANGQQSPASNASVLNNAESPAVEYTLGIIAAVLLLGALVAPPLVAHNTRRRAGGQ